MKNKTLNEQVRTLLQFTCRSNKEFATKTSITYSVLHSFLNDNCNITVANLQKILLGVGVDLSSILEKRIAKLVSGEHDETSGTYERDIALLLSRMDTHRRETIAKTVMNFTDVRTIDHKTKEAYTRLGGRQ